MPHSYRLLTVLVLLSLLGCVAVPVANTHDTEQALKFRPHPDKATLYVYRTTRDYSAVELHLSIDGTDYRTFGNSFTRIELPPGEHIIETDIPDILGSDQRISLNTAPGEVYFLEYQPVNRVLLPDQAFIHHHDGEHARKQIRGTTPMRFVAALTTDE